MRPNHDRSRAVPPPVRVAATALALGLLLPGCTSSGPEQTVRSTTSAPLTATQAGSAPATPSTTGLPTLATPSISIPPNLCTGAREPRDAADALMGALSAGELDQARACIRPGTVADSVLAGLAVREPGTAVYLPDPTTGESDKDGNVYNYTGNGKRVHVTVARQADGTYAVTALDVQPG